MGISLRPTGQKTMELKLPGQDRRQANDSTAEVRGTQ